MDCYNKQKSPVHFTGPHVLPGPAVASRIDHDAFELEFFKFYGGLLDLRAFIYQGYFAA
jgi:hypothetical protein